MPPGLGPDDHLPGDQFPRGQLPDADDVPENVAAAVVSLHRLFLGTRLLPDVLQRVVELASQVLPGAAEASLTVRQSRAVAGTTVAWSGLLALELDETQYHFGDGPCLTAASTGEPTLIADTATDSRWRAFCARAVDRGAGSVLSLPLRLPLSLEEQHQGRAQVRAALNLYALQPGAFPPASVRTGTQFAEGAAWAVANMRAYAASQDTIGGLRESLESRMVIEQAKGVLMATLHCTAEEAFTVLAERSQAANRKLRDIAAELIDQHPPPE